MAIRREYVLLSSMKPSQEYTIQDLVKKDLKGMTTRPTIMSHVRRLKQLGFVVDRRESNKRFVRITQSGISVQRRLAE